MCTLSWLPLPDGYALALNRDERRTRAVGAPPAVHASGGLPMIYPVDAKAGGTWIVVNAAGHCIVLVSHREDAPYDEDPQWISRGLLLLELADGPGPTGLAAALATRPLARYRPFTLASLAPSTTPRLFHWNGHDLHITEASAPGMLAASSGLVQAAAERERGKLFAAAAKRPGGLALGGLIELHRSHLPRQGPLSICMHRDDAVTVSSSLVVVDAEQVRFRQIEGAPCENGEVTELVLPRIAQAG